MTSTDTVLRSLDPASRDVDPHGPRARADLARILAAPPAAPVRPRRRRAGRLVLATTAAAGVAVGASIVVPSLTGGDTAFATWTAAPSAVSAAASAEIADACRDAQRDGAGRSFEAELASATAAVAERRGAWTLALLAGDDGFSALCITDESTPLFRSSIGYVGRPEEHVAPGPRELSASALGSGTVDGADLSMAAGAAGSDVAAVTYHSAEHGDVAATVAAGHFAFWLPGGELTDTSAGVPVTVTHTDGTTAVVTLRL
ncbi:hypothetical protein [Jiangella alba]|uniref:Uncharacterized protein n=1 Tax=Jiangella alba TaxID=561176 RepID=A0A1H5MF81_9ACTN|nr:hypothetical protein [Jiangella alba]SEE87803.1 hypothetical protein SAMN04488561_3123 [Jiangella alba]